MPLQSLPAELFVEILRALALFERESILIASKTPSQHGDPVSSRTLLDAFLPYMLVSRIWRSEIENTIYSSVRLSGPAKAVLFSRTIVTSPRGSSDTAQIRIMTQHHQFAASQVWATSYGMFISGSRTWTHCGHLVTRLWP
ncbi:hypothetical protein DL93DRAFT_2075280 [Clavulina sp. PMI_390]|nr:hypothetical protein DL93DRAFT_2075280 [Clavulina sp. PMI_390]